MGAGARGVIKTLSLFSGKKRGWGKGRVERREGEGKKREGKKVSRP